ncbi:MAG TPA: hypothetical protein VM734_22455 [Kofleriaceae bacterium]|jgi:ppGpp synthetase/RelA/SpoT-type nucleotidyltranferase|nr:hypothetical protein [Kofleriaceae bacterium]
MSERPTALPHPAAREALLAEYDRVADALRVRGEALRAALLGWLTAAGIKVHSVTVRVKHPASLARKLARPDRSYHDLWDVTDLIGLRVITYFEDSVDQVARVLETHFAVDLARSTDKRRRGDSTGFGYRSLHYVCDLGAPRPPEGADDALPARARCEVQVRTLLEHTWAEIEHDLGYKAPDAVPAAARRRLSRLAGLLELADSEFVAIRDELADYARTLPRRIEAAGEDVALDEVSLVPLLACPEVSALDQAIAGVVGRELGDESFFPDYLVKMLQVSGIHTFADARAGVQAHGATILAMVTPYFRVAWSTWRLSTERMDRLFRGYALFFLAHAHVLDRPGLALDKVERLARLYRELDYPDDPRAAQRVASLLVDAFRELPPARHVA